MTPPAEAWAAWIYRAAMMVLGIFGMAMVTWLHIDVAYGEWPPSLAGKRLELLGQFGLAQLALLAVQQVGLVARNLVRNLKASGAGFSIEANSHESLAE